MAIGFLPLAAPTARTALGLPSSRAISPYDRVCHRLPAACSSRTLGRYRTFAALSGNVLGNHIRSNAPPFSVASEIFLYVSAVLDHTR
jgi:hypothetical protein